MITSLGIIGAGWLGSAIANAWPGPVLATTRHGGRPDRLDPQVATMALDLLAPELAPGALATVDAWLFAIAPGADQPRHALYVDGPARLLAQLHGTSVRRVVWLSSTSALPDGDHTVDETCAQWPDHPRGRVQREAEHAVMRACEAAAVPCLVLRLGGLYGPGRELGRLYDSAPEQVLPGDGMTATNLVHRDDAVAAALAALRVPADRVGIVHVVDDDHGARRDMIDAVRAERGAPPVRWAQPRGPEIRGKRVVSARLHAWLGVTLQHPRHSPLARPPGRA